MALPLGRHDVHERQQRRSPLVEKKTPWPLDRVEICSDGGGQSARTSDYLLPSNSYTSALLETRHAVIRFLPIVHSTIGYLLAGGVRPPHSRGIPMRTHGSSGRWCTPIWGGLEVID